MTTVDQPILAGGQTLATARGEGADSISGQPLWLDLDEVVTVSARHAEETDRTATFPTDALTALRASGALGLLVPVQYGGLGGGCRDMVDITLRLARTDMAVALIFAMHCQQVEAVVRFGSPEARSQMLPAIARGEVYLASVTTEASKGGALLTAESSAPVRDRLVHLDRFAPIVTGGAHADAYLITVLAAGATSPTQVSLVYARRDQLDARVVGGWNPLGMRATHSVPMKLTGAVPESQVIGVPGDFRAIATSVFAPLAHLGWSAAWLGTAAGALARATAQLKSPESRSRVTSELVLTRLAKIRARLDMVHGMLRHTVDVFTSTPDTSRPSVQLLLNALKCAAAEQCYEAVNEVVDLIGLRHGYMCDSPLFIERALRDLRSASLNFSNDRLYLSSGALALMDPEVRLV